MRFLKDSLLVDNIICSQPLFIWYCSCFPGALERILFLKDSVSVSEYLLQPSILSSGLWLLQENWKSNVFISGEQLQSCFFLGVLVYSTGPDTLIFVWKVPCTTYKTTCSHSFCHGEWFNLTKVVPAVPCKFHNSNRTYPFWQCSHFLRRTIAAICGQQGWL